jgi:hypothetical protein
MKKRRERGGGAEGLNQFLPTLKRVMHTPDHHLPKK